MNPDLDLGEDQEFISPVQEEGQLPVFSPKQVAAFFFARERQFFFYHLEKRYDDQPLVFPRDKNNRYALQLRHIEMFTHALFQSATIDFRQLERTLLIIKCVAGNYRLI